MPSRRVLLRIVSGVLLALGATAAALSTTYPAYHDESRFQAEVMALPYESSSSEAYWRVREAHLTPKFALLDWGLTAVAAAFVVVLFAELGSSRLGRRYWTVWALANAAAVATTGTFVGSLLLDGKRDEYPPWADSLGIPLMATPVLLVATLLWANVLVLPVWRRWRAAPLRTALARGAGWWRPAPLLLRVICAANALVLALDAAAAEFGFAAAMGLWLYASVAVLANVNAGATPAAGPGVDRPLARVA